MPFRKLKIAIAVHGRFHAFDLARELLRRGHDVKLFTNYPKWAVERFDVPRQYLRSAWPEGVATRLFWGLQHKGVYRFPEAWLHQWFGRWAAAQITKEDWDVVMCFSGIGEETFRALSNGKTLRVCHRSSSHICAQASLLEEEEERVGIRQDRPSQWMIAREQREYALADVIHVPSTFAKETFLTERVLSEKVDFIAHGVNTRDFRPNDEVIEARCARILSGEPLRVLNVGTFCFRKGMWDMAEVIKRLYEHNFQFRFVGPVASEASSLVSNLHLLAAFIPKRPQHELPAHYEWGDLFILPTIEDGYPFVLAQASAASLPILTTPNGAGTDLVYEGRTGWVVPIRNPEALIERLRWCDANRKELAAMVRHIHQRFQPRDWSDVAADFERLCNARLGGKSGSNGSHGG